MKNTFFYAILFSVLLLGAFFLVYRDSSSLHTAEVVALPVSAGYFSEGFITPASCGSGFGHPTWGGACSFTCPGGTVLDSPQQSCPPPPLGCPPGQTNPHSVCQGTSCVSVAGCGSSLCANNNQCIGGGGGGGVISSFAAAPGSITQGQSTQLSWVSNQSSCSIDQGIGGVAGSGSVTVSPTVTTTYTLTCGPKTAKVTVLVSSKPKFKEVVPE